MSKIIMSITGVLILGGLIWIAQPDPSTGNILSANKSGVLTVEEENNHDFGTISMAAGIITHNFKVKNNSSEPVKIKKIYTSCMCTTATLITAGARFGPFGMPGHQSLIAIDTALEPGEEAVIEAVFDPAAHGPDGTGLVRRIIYVHTSDSREPSLSLSFEATVIP